VTAERARAGKRIHKVFSKVDCHTRNYTAMPRIHQENFTCLAVNDWKEADSPRNILLRASACAGLKYLGSKTCSSNEIAQIAPEEADTMVTAWNASTESGDLTAADESDIAKVDGDDNSFEIYDPVRRMPNPAPPQRFTRRTSGRRVIKRVVSDDQGKLAASEQSTA
jgi:hypothetical protein